MMKSNPYVSEKVRARGHELLLKRRRLDFCRETLRKVPPAAWEVQLVASQDALRGPHDPHGLRKILRADRDREKFGDKNHVNPWIFRDQSGPEGCVLNCFLPAHVLPLPSSAPTKTEVSVLAPTICPSKKRQLTPNDCPLHTCAGWDITCSSGPRRPLRFCFAKVRRMKFPKVTR